MPDRVQAVQLHPLVKLPTVTGGKAAALAAVPMDAPLTMDLEMQVSSETIKNLVELLRRMQSSKNFSDPKLHSESPTGGMAPGKDNLYNLALSVNYAQ